MLCLGIETSCDETGLALVKDGKILNSVLASQIKLHSIFGGVVPELASREHYRYIAPLFDELILNANVKIDDIDLIAVTRGPGLLGSILVGVGFAKALSLSLEKPILGINHLLAHIFAVGIEHEIQFPCLGLLISGGHTNLYRINSYSECIQLGRTLDDAVGECFDKVAKVLGLPYPGGSKIESLSNLGIADPKIFPRPYVNNKNLDFSFSGLKTSVMQYVDKYGKNWPHPLDDIDNAPQELKNCCASFTQSICETLCDKVSIAIENNKNIKQLIVAGGVAANFHIRFALKKILENYNIKLLFPSPSLCTDNASMIAYFGWLLGKDGFRHNLSMESIPRGQKIPNDMAIIS